MGLMGSNSGGLIGGSGEGESAPCSSPCSHAGWTPGPWKIHENGSRANRYLAVIDSIPDKDGKVMANCICHVATTNEQAEANAAAIADVPAMLHALRELVDFAEVDEHHRYHERSKAAFDRAYDLLEKHGG